MLNVHAYCVLVRITSGTTSNRTVLKFYVDLIWIVLNCVGPIAYLRTILQTVQTSHGIKSVLLIDPITDYDLEWLQLIQDNC